MLLTSLTSGYPVVVPSGGIQIIVVKLQETEAAAAVPVGKELALFITEPETDDGAVSTSSSPAKSISGHAKNPALKEVSGENGFQMENELLEIPTSLYLPHRTCAVDQWESSGAQTLQVITTGNTVSHNVLLDTLDHSPSISHLEGLRDILTPGIVPIRQTERGIVCVTRPHEDNELKTIHDSPCMEHLSKVDFPTTLECSEPESRETDLSLMHEQLRTFLYEEEGWDCDFTCTSREVKSLAAGSNPAKGAEGLNVTGDVSTEHQAVPGHLTEDNQLVTELASALEMVMGGYTDCNSLLKTDGTGGDVSMSQSSLALPVETDVMRLGASFEHSTEKPSVPLSRGNLFDAEIYLEDNQRQTRSGNDGPIPKSASQGGKVMIDNVSSSHTTEPPLSVAYIEALEIVLLSVGQKMLVEGATDYFGESPDTEQDFYYVDWATEKQSNETPARNSHIAACQSRIEDGANSTQLSPEEYSSTNFSDKNVDQLTSEGRSSITAIDKSTEENFQEKGTELTNAQSGGNCGTNDVLTGNNNEDFQAAPHAGNYSYHMLEHNLVLDISSIIEWDEPEDADIYEAVFKTSYEGKFLSEGPLGSNQNEGNSVSQETRDCTATPGEIIPESGTVLETLLPDSQQRISGGKPSIADTVCAVEKVMRMDITGFTPDSKNTIAGIIKNECTSSGQVTLDASNIVGIVCSQEANQEGMNEERSMKTSEAESSKAESLMPTESMQSKVEKGMSEQTPELRQDQYQRVGEEKEIQIVHYERDTGERETSIPFDYGETEVEPYMRALMDPEEQIWLGSVELEQKEHQNLQEGKQTQITPCERDTRDHQESLECDLDEAEVEPYMRVLLTLDQIHSWHESINYLCPSGEHTGVSKEEYVGTSTSDSGDGMFTADENKNLKTPELEMKAPGSVAPCACEYSKVKLLQSRLLSRASAEPPDDPRALKEERATLQETSKLCKAPQSSPEDVKRKQETVKKKTVSKVQVKKPRLGAKENAGINASGGKKVSKAEAGQREQRKPPSEIDSKAPKLLKNIQAELFPDCSGNIKLCCQFMEIHEDAVITWTKDSQLLARVQRSAGDEFPVSLAIVQAGKKDQGIYCCCLKNAYGKATADFNLTSEVLEHLSSFQDVEGLEEIEFLQLMFREDFICDSYFSNSLHGRITTEELHFGEGVHRKAFRSKVMQGLVPVFSPGHLCVLKVHNAIAYGTKNNDELVKKNYKLALQECYIQNTAREYAKIYAAEATQLESFGEVPEIIPIFLIHRPNSNIPYATVEEELIGDFVKYSVKDGKEISFMRRDSEAGQKCCTFQHWVYERTGGGLLITDMQGLCGGVRSKASDLLVPHQL
uniref:Uncharacterized protein n=1 Tax=Sphaerodactylus townsendi TaxID=933632 RepID=A0ACB8EPP6_9SAUR